LKTCCFVHIWTNVLALNVIEYLLKTMCQPLCLHVLNEINLSWG
jgi:hypothetical protein